MKKFFCIFIIIMLFPCQIIHAENDVVAYTQETDVECYIDELFIESYSINGFMYLPVEKLTEYGFKITNNDNSIALDRKTIFYFDGDYTKNKTTASSLPVYKNPTPVLINGSIANTYLVNDKIVIQADELAVFGDFKWLEKSKGILISIVVNELINAFEKAEDKVADSRNENGSCYIVGQMKNGVWNGIVKKSDVPNGMMYIGYMIDGEYEGVVYGHRPHLPYLAELSSIETIKNGKPEGYCRYTTGYNNKPPVSGEILSRVGMYEGGKLKNGSYTVASDNESNTVTYIVRDFQPQIISSMHEYIDYKRSNSQILYNDELIQFDVLPIIENDRTLIPLRGLFDKIGAAVTWDSSSKTATVTKDDMVLSFKIDHFDVIINNAVKYMDTPVRLVDGNTMIPLRFLSEELGYRVDWDDMNNSIKISE